MKMVEIWQMRPEPRRVCAVGEELFEEYTAYTWLLDRTVLSQAVLFPANTPMTVAYKFMVS